MDCNLRGSWGDTGAINPVGACGRHSVGIEDSGEDEACSEGANCHIKHTCNGQMEDRWKERGRRKEGRKVVRS